MKVLIAIALTAALGLAGCMSNSYNEKSKTADAPYSAEHMKESDAYKIIYREGVAMDNAILMKYASHMIDLSLLYEAGKITREEFESRDRKAQSYAVGSEAEESTVVL